MCTICLDTVVNTEPQKCGHLFHNECLDTWAAQFEKRTFNCPNCRYPLSKKYKYTNPPDFVIHFDKDPTEEIAGKILIILFSIYAVLFGALIYAKKLIDSA